MMYLNIASVILVVFTITAILEERFFPNGVGRITSVPLALFLQALFIYCYFHMYILPIFGLFFLFKRKTILNGVLYIASGLFYLIFYMTFSDWDRF